LDGGVRVIYRIISPETTTPSIIAGKKITIMPYSATVVESEGKGAQLPLNLALFLFFLKEIQAPLQILLLGDNLLQDFIVIWYQ